MNQGYITLLRVKRKRDDAIQQDLVVEGLSERPEKRAATSISLARMRLQADQSNLRKFTHIASLPEDRLDWTTSQEKIACLLQDFSRDSSSATGNPKSETLLKYRVYDVERPLAATGSDRDAAQGSCASRKWQARLANSKGGAADQPMDVIYDLYTVSESPGMHSAAECSEAPVVYVHDEVVFADEVNDSAEEYNDSDNPDEEGHHTHDYPDNPSGDDTSRENRTSRSFSHSSEEETDWRDA